MPVPSTALAVLQPAADRATGQVKLRSKRKDMSLFAVNTTSNGLIYAATTRGEVLAITPVAKPGTYGEWVLDARPMTVAVNR